MPSTNYEIPDVSEFVVNNLFLKADSETGNEPMPYAVALTVLNDKFETIITVVEPFNMNNDPDREDAPEILEMLGWLTADRLVFNAPDVLISGFAFLTLTLGTDLAQAERWSAYFQNGLDRHELPTFGMVATNGTDWTDIATNRNGSIPPGYTTAFEQYNTFHGRTFSAETFTMEDADGQGFDYL